MVTSPFTIEYWSGGVLINTETVEVELSPEETAQRDAEATLLVASAAIQSAETMPDLMAAMKAESAARLDLMRVRGELPSEAESAQRVEAFTARQADAAKKKQ